MKPNTIAGGASFSSTNPRYILAKSPANVGQSNYLFRLRGGYVDFTYRGSSDYVTQRTDSEVVTVGTFHYVVAVHNGTSIVIYVDGVIVASTLTSGTVTESSYTNTSDFIIGKQGLGTIRYFDGNISNISIYNRALTPDEIRQNYNATRGRFQ